MWKKTIDPASGQPFWYNRETQISTWEKPDGVDDDDAPVLKDEKDKKKKKKDAAASDSDWALRRHFDVILDDASIDLDITRAISELAKTALTDEDHARIRALSIWPRLFSLLKSSIPMTQTNAARFMAKCSNNAETADVMQAQYSLRELALALRKNNTNEDVLRFLSYAISNLAKTDELRALAGKEGVLREIVDAMKNFPLNADLTDNCCYALSKLSFENKINVSFIKSTKGIEILIKAMDTHLSSPLLLESAIACLSNLCAVQDSNIDAVISAQGAHQIALCCISNVEEVDLLICSFAMFGSLANNSKRLDAVLPSGILEAIVTGMKTHPNNPQLLEVALQILANIVACLTDDQVALIQQEGVLHQVLQVLQDNLDNVDVLKLVFGVLVNLSANTLCSDFIIQEGLGHVLKAASAVSSDVTGCIKAARVMQLLTANDDQDHKNHGIILESNIIEIAFELVKKHYGIEQICNYGIGIVLNLIVDKKIAKKVAKNGGSAFALELISSKISFPFISREAFKLLAAMVLSESSAVALADVGIEKATASLKQYAGSADVIISVLMFLSNLFTHPDLGSKIPDCKLVPMMLSILPKHDTDDGVLLYLIQCMENMGLSSGIVREYLRGNKVGEALKGVLSKEENFNKPDLTKAVNDAIQAINKRELQDQDFKQLKSKRLIDIVDDEPAKVEVKPTLTKSQKNFLRAGGMVTLHKEGNVSKVHLLCDDEFKSIKVNDLKLKSGETVKVMKIKAVTAGRCLAEHMKKKFGGKFAIKDESSCFGIEGGIEFAFECASQDERDSWCSNLQALLKWHNFEKEQSKMIAARFSEGILNNLAAGGAPPQSRRG